MDLRNADLPIAELTSASALRLLKNLLTMPFLGYVPIHPYSFDTERSSEISTQLVISEQEGGKTFVTDNAAPMPRVWNVKGYLKGIPYVELTNWFMPSLQAQKLIIDTWHKSRKAVPFRTTDGEYVDVLVKKVRFLEEPEAMNVLKIEATVQEFNYLTVVQGVGSNAATTAAGLAKSVPSMGSMLGTVIAVGGVGANIVIVGAEAAIKHFSDNEDKAVNEAMQERLVGMEQYSFPVLDAGTEYFSFYCSTSIGTLYITMRYDEGWSGSCQLDQGGVRSFKLTTNIVINPLAADYSLYFTSPKTEIGVNELSDVKVNVLLWQ